MSFNTNVAGQIAIARSLDQAINQEYKGFSNYLEYSQSVFQQGRDAAINLLGLSKGIKFRPTKCESGYFLPVDISGCEDQIPAKYFTLNVNYEPDQKSIIPQMQFPKEMGKVPLDFALCRYLAVEKGLSIMPLSNFCLHESENKKT